MMKIATAAVLTLPVCCAVFLAQPARGQAALENDMIVYEYNPPTTEKYMPIYEKMKKIELLERLSKFLSPLQLEGMLNLSLEEGNENCKGPNSYYDMQGTVHLCYSWFYFLENQVGIEHKREPSEPFTATSLGLIPGFTRAEVLIGGTISIILHELGHALFHINEIPLFGREEDAADQIAGLLMLQFGNKVALTTIKGTYNAWHHFNAAYLRRTKGQIRPSMEADSHSLDIQRAYNYLCMAYGKDPETFKDLAERLLPRIRRDNCPAEYKQAADAFNKTVMPWVDQKKMEMVLKMEVLRPSDFDVGAN